MNRHNLNSDAATKRNAEGRKMPARYVRIVSMVRPQSPMSGPTNVKPKSVNKNGMPEMSITKAKPINQVLRLESVIHPSKREMESIKAMMKMPVIGETIWSPQFAVS